MCCLRVRLARSVKRCRAAKVGRTIELLGCSLKELREHIEAQFEPGMTWDNYGAWHVDHIRQCCTFDLTDEAQQRVCFHCTNLRPLWAEANLARPRPKRRAANG
jgi:hypothetical protein